MDGPVATTAEKRGRNQATSSLFETSNDPLHSSVSNLSIEVLESGIGAKGTVLKVTPKGLVGSLRAAGDGMTIVGSSPAKEKAVDYSMEQDRGMLAKRHFMLVFEKGVYYISDAGSTTGTFLRVHRSFPLQSSTIISFGSVYLQVSIIGTFLQLKFLSGLRKSQEVTYTPEASPVLLGRNNSCALVFDDGSLSRYQCSMVYEVKAGWVLFDGLNTCKPSTNGTWIYTTDKVEVWDGLVFKAGSSLFRVTLCHQ